MTAVAGSNARELTELEKGFFNQLYITNNVQLNDVQMQSVLHQGTQLLLAAPGTGKTTTTITKIGYMIDVLGYNPSKILAVTFSKAAAVDMEKRFKKLFPQHPDGIVHFSTIHSLAFDIYRYHMSKTKQPYQMIEGSEEVDQNGKKINLKTRIISKIYQDVMGEYPSEDIREGLKLYISLVKNLLTTPEQLAEDETRSEDILEGAAEVYDRYEEFKRSQNPVMLDYDDMLVDAYRILNENDEVREYYKSKFDVVMIDEGQDTSFVQHAIAEILIEDHQNLFMVADDDQTIYKFRGSDVENLLVFGDKYPNGVILKMEHNYRSTKIIVDVANAFIKAVKKRYDKNMFTDKADGNPIAVNRFGQHRDQLKFVINHIKKMDNLSEVAVLYRNNASSIGVAFELMKNKIPFYLKEGDARFFSHFVMKDLRNYLRLAFGEKVKHMKLIEDIRPRFRGYLKPSHITELATKDLDMNLWDALCDLCNIQPYQIEFFNKCKKIFPTMKNMKPVEAIDTVLDELQYRDAMKKYVEFTGMNMEGVERVLSTIKMIAESSNNLVEFYETLDDLANAIRDAKGNAGKNAVTLSTFHSSKGLEWDTVFCIDLQVGQIPTMQEIEAATKRKIAGALDEAYRLMYVGMTRARKTLHLCCYTMGSKPSQFVKEVEAIIKKREMAVRISANQPEGKNQVEVKDLMVEQEQSLNLEVGAKVYHKKFGDGVVRALSEERVDVEFETKGLRSFLVEYCVNNKILENI